MNIRHLLMFFLFSCISFPAIAQLEHTGNDELNSENDSLYIAEVEEQQGPYKVLHAEPLFIDLIRDLGARKGEKEWNIGLGITDRLKYDSYGALVEYEFAPIDRLGIEFEVPVTFYTRNGEASKDSVPSHRVESFKAACQYTFLVSKKYTASLAIGYINELEFADIKDMRNEKVLHSNIVNPFFVAAKRWGNHVHTLIYTGPKIDIPLHEGDIHTRLQMNSNFHYMIPGTRNFIGMEVNKELNESGLKTVVRPQMRVGVADNLMIGIVAGVPVNRQNERLSTFLRLIYEPGHKTSACQ